MVTWINLYPLLYKGQIMGKSGNIRANQFIYKQAADLNNNQSAVILDEDGEIGNYNRGNRSIGHFLENALPILVTLPIGFKVFPVPSALLFINYSIGRMVYQIGYTSIGFGAHVSGFVIDRFSTFTMLSLVLIAGVVMIAYDGPPPDQLALA